MPMVAAVRTVVGMPAVTQEACHLAAPARGRTAAHCGVTEGRRRRAVAVTLASWRQAMDGGGQLQKVLKAQPAPGLGELALDRSLLVSHFVAGREGADANNL